MKKPLILLFSLSSALAFAQSVPGTIPFNARLTNTTGQPLSGAHAMNFRLFEQSAGGSASWTESAGSVTFTADGLASVELGAASPLSPTLFTGSRLFLEIELDGAVLSPRVALGTVPYAFRAAVASSALTLGTLTPNDVQARVTGTCPAGQAVRAIAANGTVTCEAAASQSRQLYHRLMTPGWLLTNATFGTTRARTNTSTSITFGTAIAGTGDYERLFTVPVLAAGTLDPTQTWLVRIVVNRTAPPSADDNDPIFGVTDGISFVGLGRSDAANGTGFYGVSGTDGATLTGITNTGSGGAAGNPTHFEVLMRIAPGSTAGTAEFFVVGRTGADSMQLQTTAPFDLSRPFTLNVYSNNPAETYTFNTFEVSVEREG